FIQPAFFQRSGDDRATIFEERKSNPRDRLMRLSIEDALKFAAGSKQLTSGASFQDVNDISTAFEERAQEILLRYLLGDRFPADPLKPTARDFNAAAKFLDAAL